MYRDLYEYLILNKQISIPGVGTFLLERKPAETDITHRQIKPSAYTIALHPDSGAPGKKFYNWLSGKLNLHYHEAIVRFNNFSYDLKDLVLSGNKIEWDNVGVLSKGIAGDIKFESSLQEYYFDQPVSAARIIREKAIHKVRVGDEEKTSTEMSERLHPEEKSKTYWWAPALIVAIVLVIIIGIYFSQQGLNVSATGDQKEISPQKASSTYTIPK